MTAGRRLRATPLRRTQDRDKGVKGGTASKLPLNRLRTRPAETRRPNRIPGLRSMLLPRGTRRSGIGRTGHWRDLPRDRTRAATRPAFFVLAARAG